MGTCLVLSLLYNQYWFCRILWVFGSLCSSVPLFGWMDNRWFWVPGECTIFTREFRLNLIEIQLIFMGLKIFWVPDFPKVRFLTFSNGERDQNERGTDCSRRSVFLRSDSKSRALRRKKFELEQVLSKFLLFAHFRELLIFELSNTSSSMLTFFQWVLLAKECWTWTLNWGKHERYCWQVLSEVSSPSRLIDSVNDWLDDNSIWIWLRVCVWKDKVTVEVQAQVSVFSFDFQRLISWFFPSLFCCRCFYDHHCDGPRSVWWYWRR